MYLAQNERLDGMVDAVAILMAMGAIKKESEQAAIWGLSMAAEDKGFVAEQVRDRINQRVGEILLLRSEGGQ